MKKSFRLAAKSIISLVFCLFALNTLFAQDFTLKDLDNNTVTLSSYKGKQPVILLFWTTWCPFCRKELEDLNKNYSSLAKEGIEVLAVSVAEPSRRVSSFAKKYSLSLRIILDEDGAVSDSFGVRGVPTLILIDKNGAVYLETNSFPKKQYKELLLK